LYGGAATKMVEMVCEDRKQQSVVCFLNKVKVVARMRSFHWRFPVHWKNLIGSNPWIPLRQQRITTTFVLKSVLGNCQPWTMAKRKRTAKKPTPMKCPPMSRKFNGPTITKTWTNGITKTMLMLNKGPFTPMK